MNSPASRSGGSLWIVLPAGVVLLLAAAAWARANEADPPSKAAASVSDAVSSAADAARTAASRRHLKSLIGSLTVFGLAVFLGFEIITKVPPTLHTPLMSGSNAISGITLVGALLVAGAGQGTAPLLGLVAVALATVNVVGGFLVTHRMLAMFRTKKKAA